MRKGRRILAWIMSLILTVGMLPDCTLSALAYDAPEEVISEAADDGTAGVISEEAGDDGIAEDSSEEAEPALEEEDPAPEEAEPAPEEDQEEEDAEDDPTEEDPDTADLSKLKPKIVAGEFFHNEDGSHTLQVEYNGDDKAYNVELYTVKELKDGDPKGEMGIVEVDGKKYNIIGIMTIDQHNKEKYYKNDKGRWVIRETLYYGPNTPPRPGETTLVTVGTIGPENPSELCADPVKVTIPEKGKSAKLEVGGKPEKTYTITVKYSVPKGYTAPSDQTFTGTSGTSYSLVSPTIKGLIPDQAVVSGTIGSKNENFTVKYTKGPAEKNLDEANVVGLNEDETYEYTKEKLNHDIGLEDKSGVPIVKGKEYTQTITEKTEGGKQFWVIEFEHIEGKSTGKKTIEVLKASKSKHNVTVHYTLPAAADGMTGQTVAPTVVESFYEGENYSIAAPMVAVPGKKDKYYSRSAQYVTGTMGKADVEHTVIYTWEETAASWYNVEVYYQVEANGRATPPNFPKNVKKMCSDGDKYCIYTPDVEGYTPDVTEVSGRIQGKSVAVTVTYKPDYYYLTIHCNYPYKGAVLEKEKYPNGASYHYNMPNLLYMNSGATDKQRSVWIIDPPFVDGTIQNADVDITVTVTCPHPASSLDYLNGGKNHNGYCQYCHQKVLTEDHSFGDPAYMTPEELVGIKAFATLELAQSAWPAGAMAKVCSKCGCAELSSPDEDYCPARPAEEKAKHLWSIWQKVNDNQCSRTCARCKKTVTVSHAWGEWEYLTSKSHSRRCSLCHCTQTSDHGAWSNATVHKKATCISDAEVGATCGICNKQINNVYYGIVGSINPEYVRTGHDFTGGYAKIHGGHVQRCKICGAFDMEHEEAHAWSDWYATEGGDSCTGIRKMRRECKCGAYETKTEENSHNYVRDPSREIAVTCESAGKECYTCSKCGDHNDKDVAALGHAWVEDEGNYPAKCGQEGRMWWHCANPGCSATKKDDCPAPSQHEWVPHWLSKPSCTRGGVKDGEICSHCGDRRNEGNMDYVDRLNHDLETTRTLKRSGTYVSKTGTSAIDEEVWVVTNRCKTCGYQFPEAVYTVARSSNISKYKIEPGDVRVNEIGDGITVTGRFGKDNAVYFNNTVNGAFKEVVDNLLNIYRQKEGSIITEFKPEFMNSLADGEYEMIQVNGDEIAAATLTVKNHKFVTPEGAQNGKLPGIKALDESGVITSTVDPDLCEKIMVNGQEVDYYPWMADGELLFYLGQIEDNATSHVHVPNMGGGYTALAVKADPCVTPATADFDGREGNKEYADVVVVKSDKGYNFDSAHPISLFGEYVPETEDVKAGEEGTEMISRTNYVIDGDKLTFKKEYLASLGEGEHIFLINYKDAKEPGKLTINIKGTAAAVAASGQQESWNLFENADEHSYRVSGISYSGEAVNTNKASSKYFTATLTGNVITVNLKEGADRRKAAAANTFDFDLGEEGAVSYILPFTYNKPSLKLSSTKGTVRKGKLSVVSTTVSVLSENGNYVPFDLSNATVTYGTASIPAGSDGIVRITASGKASEKIKIVGAGWNEKDPVELKYAITEVKSEKDVLTVDLGGLKQVVLNSNVAGQSLSFPVMLNGEAATTDTVTITANKTEAEQLAVLKSGKLIVSLGGSGLKKGSYTLTLASKNDKTAKVKVKVRISDKALSAAANGKVKQKLDVVNGLPMLVVPNLKEVSGKITGVNVEVTDAAAEYKDFKASLSDGSICVSYVGAKPLDAKKTKIGTMKFSLTVEGIDTPVEFTIKNVAAKKFTPKVKAAKPVVPGSAADKADGSGVIATSNILSTYKDSAKHVRILKPEKVELACTNVTATLDPADNTRILVNKLDGSSGTVKATLTYAGGVTKTVVIKVKKGK